MRLILVIAVEVLLALASFGQSPPAASVDGLLDKLAETKKQQADLAKTATDLTSEIRARLRAMNQRLEELAGPTPGPGPAPGPNPGPGPAPAPTDPLAVKISAAFKADAGELPAKKSDAAALAALYSVAVEQRLAEDATLQTAGDLIGRIRAAGASLAAERLTGTRRVIGEELAALLKSADTPLTPESRKAATALFVRIEAALEECAK